MTGPTDARRPRLLGVDSARGLALLGMMAVHVLPSEDPDGSATTSYLIAGGRSAATFAVMAGVGLALVAGGTRPPRGRPWGAASAGLLVRALAIGAIGLGLGYADSKVAVILPYYAVLFVLAIPLLPLRSLPLGVLSAVIAVALPVIGFLLRDDDRVPFLGANLTFGSLADAPGQVVQALTLTGYYPALAWTAYVCAGLAAGRLDLRARRPELSLLVGGIALALAASLSSWLLLGPGGGRAEVAATLQPEEDIGHVLELGQYGNVPTTSWWWLSVDSPHSTTPFDLLHTTGVALGLLGACLLLARLRTARVLLVPVAAAGSMTLTLYTAHVLLLASGVLPDDPETSYAVQVVGVLALATLWRRTLGRGPLERAVSVLADPVRAAVGPRAASVVPARPGIEPR